MTSRLTRFAPSPTGWLHLGHARAAREAFGFADEVGGECLLRIEDIDHTRCKPEYTQGIYEDLRWLGFDWPEPVRVQSQHLRDYAGVAERLRGMGVLYPCSLSRKEVAARSEGGVFRGQVNAAKPRLGDNPAWRICIPVAQALTGSLKFEEDGVVRHVDFGALSDDILVRRDIQTSYLIACTHDDAVQGISDVVRGMDLEDVTPMQVVLQALMGWESPRYWHHALVMDGPRKLSKRDGDMSLRTLRAQGLHPEDVWERAP